MKTFIETRLILTNCPDYSIWEPNIFFLLKSLLELHIV